MPASPPQIAFSDDTLTINANNATLGDVLRAVHRQTGAVVDMPGNATDRVVGRFGPGPVRDVMTSLLNGSHFNYVLMGSQTNPNGLERIVLISKSGAEPTPQSSPAAAQNQPPMGVPQPGETPEASADDAGDTTMPEANEPTDDQANQAQSSDDQQQPPAQNPFGNGNVKTPEQLLQELQQRQQQMQQQQQQGNPQAFPQAPVQVPQQPPPPQ